MSNLLSEHTYGYSVVQGLSTFANIVALIITETFQIFLKMSHKSAYKNIIEMNSILKITIIDQNEKH